MICLVQEILDLKLFLSNARCFVPVYLSTSSRAILESDSSDSLAFSPSPFTINASQSSDFANSIAGDKGFLILNFADNLEFHD